MGFGFILKELLRNRKMTIKQLAEITNIPVNTLYSITKRNSVRVDRVIVSRIMNALDVSIMELLKIARKGINVSEEEFAAKLGVDTATLQKLESGQRLPTAKQVEEIEGFINIAVDEILEKNIVGFYKNMQEKKDAFLHGELVSPAFHELLPDGWEKFNILSEIEKNRLSIPLCLSYEFLHNQQTVALLYSFNHLNEAGKAIAVERVEELALIPKYQRTNPTEPPETPETDSKSNSSSKDENPSEGL